MRKVSIMMLSYNRSAFTKVAIQKMVENLDYPVEKFVLVDNGSTDDTINWVESYFKDQAERKMISVELPGGGYESRRVIGAYQGIYNKENKGIAIGQNQGAQACDPDTDVVMISNDIFVGPNWLSPLVKCVEMHKEQGIKLGWVSPFMSPEHLFDEIVNNGFRQDYFNHWYHRIINCNDPDSLKFIVNQIYNGDFDQFSREFVQRNAGKRWDEAVSMMFYWTREAINEVGYFDERFSEFKGRGGWGSEDVDLMLRMNNADFYRVTCFDSFVHHVICGTTRKLTLDDANFAYGDIETGGKFLRKWIEDPRSPERYYPLDTVAPKRNHVHWLERKNKDFGDVTRLDLGLTKEQMAEINRQEYEAHGIMVSK